jgi:hypothetical protein
MCCRLRSLINSSNVNYPKLVYDHATYCIWGMFICIHFLKCLHFKAHIGVHFQILLSEALLKGPMLSRGANRRILKLTYKIFKVNCRQHTYANQTMQVNETLHSIKVRGQYASHKKPISIWPVAKVQPLAGSCVFTLESLIQ